MLIMSSKFALLLITLVCLVKTSLTLSIDVPAHENECFFEDLDLGDKMTVTYQVTF